MLAFDLDKALAGAKVVTRDGRPVIQLTRFSVESPFALRGVVNGELCSWMVTGSVFDMAADQHHPNDLFLAAPDPIVRWVNFYPDSSHAFHYDTEAEADNFSSVPLCENSRCLVLRLYGRAIRVAIHPEGGAE